MCTISILWYVQHLIHICMLHNFYVHKSPVMQLHLKTHLYDTSKTRVRQCIHIYLKIVLIKYIEHNTQTVFLQKNDHLQKRVTPTFYSIPCIGYRVRAYSNEFSPVSLDGTGYSKCLGIHDGWKNSVVVVCIIIVSFTIDKLSA